MSKIIEEAYATVRSYVPEDVNRVFDEQIPKIEKYIEKELDEFAKQLAEHILQEVDKVKAEVLSEAKKNKNELLQVVEQIEADMAENDQKLIAATELLKQGLNDYENKFATLGNALNKAVSTAIKTTGIPI